MRDIGEPFSRGQVDHGAVEAGARRDAVFGVVVLTGAVLINGILAILFIALMQALGLWGPAAGEAISPDGIDQLRSRLGVLVAPDLDRVA